MALSRLAACLLLALNVSAYAIQKRATCSSYTVINTRGTGEAQGPSAGFRTMNANIMQKVAGGKEYDTVYPATWDQNSAKGTQDIVDHITATLQKNPKECFILEGYSQGAAATVNALPKITGAAFTAVKGVFLIGNPAHKAGLSCNVDPSGGKSTLDVNGMSYGVQIPANWVSKTMDVCAYGDGVCDTTHGFGINLEHGSYPNDAATQDLGTKYVVGRLTRAS